MEHSLIVWFVAVVFKVSLFVITCNRIYDLPLERGFVFEEHDLDLLLKIELGSNYQEHLYREYFQ